MLFTLLLSTGLIAETAAENLVKFVEFVNNQENQWITWMGKKQQEKGDILASDMNDWANHKKNLFNALNSLTNENKDTILSKQLKDAFEIYDKHRDRMNDFWTKKCQEGKELYLAQEKELNNLKKSLGLLKNASEESDLDTDDEKKIELEVEIDKD